MHFFLNQIYFRPLDLYGTLRVYSLWDIKKKNWAVFMFISGWFCIHDYFLKKVGKNSKSLKLWLNYILYFQSCKEYRKVLIFSEALENIIFHFELKRNFDFSERGKTSKKENLNLRHK